MEGKDDMPQVSQIPLPMVVYWHANQIAISLESQLPRGAAPVDVVKSLKLAALQKLMQMNGLQLQSFQEEDIPHPIMRPLEQSSNTASSSSEPDALSPADLNNPLGKYLFRSPRRGNQEGTSVMSFFRVVKSGMSPGGVGAGMTDGSMGTAGGGQFYEGDNTLKAVTLINNNLAYLRDAGVPVIAAAPNWLMGGTPPYGCGTHGCPVSPPVPVKVGDGDASCSGNWKLEFTHLPEQSSLQNATGKGVTVLVLDTLPKAAQIAAAAAADSNNTLLQNVHAQVTINYVDLPDIDDIPNSEQTATGKDIYGRLVGFPMNDHGTFVAGEILDLAPGAHIECIRVLNDAGVGTTAILTRALEDIQQRLEGTQPAGETRLSLPLVINMSLVATPSDEQLLSLGSPFDRDQIYLLRDTLHTAMQSLAQMGVIFVASAGNDSDPRPDASMALMKEWATPDPMGTMSGAGTMGVGNTATMAAPTTGSANAAMAMPLTRFEPRFPAAFAYDHTYAGHPTLTRIPGVIPVGALNAQNVAASYSNYSGPDGINVYGGELLTPVPATEAQPLQAGVVTDVQRPIDAVRGVYTSSSYPYLSVDDNLPAPVPVPPQVLPPRSYPEYTNPDPIPPHSMQQRATWAYWSGTSFATPMISALAARALEVDGATIGDTMRSKLAAAAQVQQIWDRPPDGVTDPNGYVIGVQQVCDSEQGLLGQE